jgi:multimeric flavodoxin WrbA
MAPKILILDGANASDITGPRVLAALQAELESRGWEVDLLTLRNMKIGNCSGDFFCWIRTPGMCVVNDDNRAVARAVALCDMLIFLTPITFGGYSATLKKAVDRLTQNNLPFFEENRGEIHHRPRYQCNPLLLAIGWMDEVNKDEAAIFHHLVQRNGMNMHFPKVVSGILYTTQTDEEVTGAIQGWVNEIQNGRSTSPLELPIYERHHLKEMPIHNALLLIGSPRGKKSTSQALGSYLLQQLSAIGLTTDTHYLYPALNSLQGIQVLLEAVDRHDLIVLAAPLYIDSLPGPVMRALELIAAHRAEKPGQAVFSAIINCGFPEAKQCEPALAICAAFALRAGLAWAGGLALGGGAGVVNGAPLVDLGWRARTIRRSLELSAACLVAGKTIPEEAIRLMEKKRIPNWLLFLASDVGWRQKSRKFGAEKLLRTQPYKMG